MAGECRSASRTIGQSVVISAPIIALMFILGTSSVLTFVGNQPINVIGPIPQTMRLALGSTGLASWAAPFGIMLLMGRAVGSASLIFTGLTRLPMTAGWDRLAPEWFTRLHPRYRTPVNSILFVCGVVMVLIALSMTGVGEQEASQLLANSSSALYGIAYVWLFALPWLGARTLRDVLPSWVKAVSVCGFFASLVSVFLTVYPIVEVGSKAVYAAKIGGVVILTNVLGVLLYRSGQRAKLK
jgi:amino acid transporter